MAVEECREDTAKEEMEAREPMCVHGLQADNMARVTVTGTHGCPWHAEPLAFKIFDCYFIEGK